MHMTAEIEIHGEDPIRSLDLATNEAIDVKNIKKIDDTTVVANINICVPRSIDVRTSDYIARKLLDSDGVNIIHLVPNAE